MPTKLIIPGLNGSGDGHWQDHWLRDDPDSVLVDQQDWSRPDLELWTLEVEKSLRQHPGAILIGHSFGALVVANVGARPLSHLVKGALLVAPCDLARGNSLHPCALNADAMPCGRLPFPSILVGSHNDPYMSFDEARQYSACLGSDFVDLGRAGHINIASGYGRWTRGYRLAKRLERHGFAKSSDTQVITARNAKPVTRLIGDQ